MQKYFSVLRQCTLFDGIADDSLLAMMSCLNARVDRFDKKYTIFAEGTQAKYIGIVLSGAVQLVHNDYFGNRSIVSEAAPAEMFCQDFACAETAHLPVSAIANEPSDILLVECRHILHTCSNSCHFHQQLIFNLMRSLAQSNLLFHQKLDVISKRTTRDKLMTYLHLQAKKAKSSRFEIPFDRQELADYLEVDRSGLSAEIGKLRDEGLLRSKKSSFELL